MHLYVYVHSIACVLVALTNFNRCRDEVLHPLLPSLWCPVRLCIDNCGFSDGKSRFCNGRKSLLIQLQVSFTQINVFPMKIQ